MFLNSEGGWFTGIGNWILVFFLVFMLIFCVCVVFVLPLLLFDLKNIFLTYFPQCEKQPFMQTQIKNLFSAFFGD